MSTITKLLKTIFFSLASLALLDVALGVYLGQSYELRKDLSSLQKYFGYGYSTENKLKAMIGDSNASAHSLILAGWNETIPQRVQTKSSDCTKNLTFYGMSFSARVASALAELDPCISIRTIGGPGAPLSHSYNEYERLNSNDNAQVVVVGVLASALPKINTVSHLSSAFEAPGAHMYPRYHLEEGTLVKRTPPAETLSLFRKILINKPDELRNFLLENDAFYSPFVFGLSSLDKSVTVRMLRRAYGQANKRSVQDQYYDSSILRFTNKDQLLDVSNALLLSLKKKTVANGQKFIVILFNDRGYAQSLDDQIGKELSTNGIQWFSSTEVIDSSNLSSFLPDGHYTSALDKELAKYLLTQL